MERRGFLLSLIAVPAAAAGIKIEPQPVNRFKLWILQACQKIRDSIDRDMLYMYFDKDKLTEIQQSDDWKKIGMNVYKWDETDV